MSGRPCYDNEAKHPLTDDVPFRRVSQSGELCGRTLFGRFTEHYQAKMDKLDQWYNQGAVTVQTMTKINSFKAKGKIIQIPDRFDISLIAVPSKRDLGKWDLKIVMRDDGLTFRIKLGKFPPYVTERSAKAERSIGGKWPLFRLRTHVTERRNLYSGRLTKMRGVLSLSSNVLSQV